VPGQKSPNGKQQPSGHPVAQMQRPLEQPRAQNAPAKEIVNPNQATALQPTTKT